MKLVLGCCQHQEGLGLLLYVGCGYLVRQTLPHLQEEKVEELERGGRGQLPPQLGQYQQLHALQLLDGDGAVREDDEVRQGRRLRMVELGCDTEAGRGQELELGGPD